MATFCTASDVVARYTVARLRDLLNLSSAATQSDILADQRVVMAVEIANNRVAAAVRKQYPNPLPKIPPELKDAAIDLSYWHILKFDIAKIGPQDDALHSAAVDFLKQVATGEYDLPFVSIKEASDATPAVIYTVGANPDTLSSGKDWFDGI